MFHRSARNDVEHPAGQVEIAPTHPMDSMRAVGLAEGWEEGTEEEVIAAWQYLHSTGLAYQLQGWFGRTAQALLDEGVIHATA